VRQVGLRRLWDAVDTLAETFVDQPQRLERPDRQTVWYRTQDGPSWDLPRP
jgi:hypothetical protein